MILAGSLLAKHKAETIDSRSLDERRLSGAVVNKWTF